MDILRRAIDRFGAWLILLPILVIAGLLLDRERSIGGLAWAALTAWGMYRFGLWLAGPLLLPIESAAESRAAARAALRRHGGRRKPAMAVVREGKVLPGPEGKSRHKASGEGAIFVDSTSLVVLGTDTRVTRVLDSGVHFTRKEEKIRSVVDLRPQARSQEVQAQTRDGIWVGFKVNARFQIDGTEPRFEDIDLEKTRLPAPYKWSLRHVTRALELERAGDDDSPTLGWDDMVVNEAVKRVHTLIAEYTFDQLIEPRDARLKPREAIRAKLEADVKQAMAGKGVKVLSVTLAQFVPVAQEVREQWIEAWQAAWMRRKHIVEAEGLAERYRLIELARAQGQMELVMRIAQALEVSQQVGAGDAEQIALRMLDVVERLAAEPEVDEQLSSESREALGEVQRRLLGRGSDDEDDGSS